MCRISGNWRVQFKNFRQLRRNIEISIGVTDRIRTDDRQDHNLELFQLSYGHTYEN
jgi:hypothetical protein